MIQGTSRSRRTTSKKSLKVRKKKNKFTSNISKLMFVSLFAIAGVSGLNYKKSVNIQIDGVQMQVLTAVNSVDELLLENKIDKTKYEINTNDDVITDGETILLSSEKVIQFTVAGETKEVVTKALTLSDFFIEQNVEITQNTYISSPATYKLDDFLVNYNTLKVDVTTHSTSEETLEIDLPEVVEETTELSVGEVKVTKGEQRIVKNVYDVTSVNGTVVKTVKTSEVVLQEGKPAVKRVGKGTLAYSEVSKETTIVQDVGMVEFTAYAVGDGATPSTVTATGHDVSTSALYDHPKFGRIFIVAVDPTVIPLGSVVEIEGIGKAIALDTGGAIKGSRIDLFMSSPSEAIKFGRQSHNVKIVE